MRAAVVGAGRIARQHLACLQQLPIESVVVCYLSAARAEAAAERFGALKWFTDHRALLDGARLDVVHVATPPESHYAIAADALEAGCHVILEKPATTSLGDLEKLIEIAQRKGRILVEDQNYLFNRSVAGIRKWLDDGRLGEIVHVDASICLGLNPNPSTSDLALPGGAIGQFLTHLACMSWVFVGEHRNVQSAWRKRSSLASVSHDEMRALVEARGGTAQLGFTAHGRPEAFVVRVQGTRAMAEAHLFEPRLVLEPGTPASALLPARNGTRRALEEIRGAFSGVWRKLSGGAGAYEGLREVITRTYRAIEDGQVPPVSVEQIVAVNRLVQDLAAQEPRT